MSENLERTANFYLLVIDEAGAVREHELGGSELTIGRNDACNLVLPDERVSGTHARLKLSGGQWHVEDAGSLNGIYVNNQKTCQRILKPGDAIRIACHKIVFHHKPVPEAAPARQTKAFVLPMPTACDDGQEPKPDEERSQHGQPEKPGCKKDAGPRKQESRLPPRASRRAAKDLPIDGTGVAPWLSFPLAAVLCAGFYAIVQNASWLSGTRLHEMTCERGWVPYATVALASWAFVILCVKVLKTWDQATALKAPLAPEGLGETVSADQVQQWTAFIESKPSAIRSKFLFRRILNGLRHFTARHNTQELHAYLQDCSDQDGHTVETSYYFVKALIAAVPMLGFLGTVLGIGQAVGHFAGAASNIQDMPAITRSLHGVAQGLGVAFDTTLLGLILSLGLMFLSVALEKSEHRVLLAVDSLCSGQLLLRLADGTSVESESRRSHGCAVRRVSQTTNGLRSGERFQAFSHSNNGGVSHATR